MLKSVMVLLLNEFQVNEYVHNACVVCHCIECNSYLVVIHPVFV